jgi:hypothetical protein
MTAIAITGAGGLGAQQCLMAGSLSDSRQDAKSAKSRKTMLAPQGNGLDSILRDLRVLGVLARLISPHEAIRREVARWADIIDYPIRLGALGVLARAISIHPTVDISPGLEPVSTAHEARTP